MKRIVCVFLDSVHQCFRLNAFFNGCSVGHCWSWWNLCCSWCWSGIPSRGGAESTRTPRSPCALKCWNRSWVWRWDTGWGPSLKVCLEIDVVFGSTGIYVFVLELVSLPFCLLVYPQSPKASSIYLFIFKVTDKIWLLQLLLLLLLSQRWREIKMIHYCSIVIPRLLPI